MTRALHISIVALAASFFAPTHALADITVILRGGVEPVKGLNAIAALRGLEVQQGTSKAAVTIPWDMVRDVEGATISGLESELAIGQDLWRGRIRVERGDEALAEPLFVKHWDRFRLQDGPTTAVIAEGLLRCALAKNELRAAVEPWFVCLRIGSNGEPSRYSDLPGVLDDTTGLLPELSPFLPASIRTDLAGALRDAATSMSAAQAGVANEATTRLSRILAASERDAKPTPVAELSRDAAPAVRALGLIEAIVSAADARAAAKAVAEFERILPLMAAKVSRSGSDLVVQGTGVIQGIDIDLSIGGELAPVIAGLAALADGPSRITGIAHLRGHETDRLKALTNEINRIGGNCRELPDGLEIQPAKLHAGKWHTYEDHRMATAGAILGLRIPGIEVENIATTSKTMPEFTKLWQEMLDAK
jgi:hypothetical protein